VAEKKRILIVDKDNDFVSELVNYLLAAGYTSIEAVNGYAEALGKIERGHFDVCLMEVSAPDLQGLDCARRMQHMKPDLETFLMIGPEHQPLINGRMDHQIGFDCFVKSTITQSLLSYLRSGDSGL
jgi:DNA-binding NtrC family response regulator